MRYGPRYLLIGSRLVDDTYMLRTFLNGLNSYGREWSETLIIEGNGSVEDLDLEVEPFRHLEYRKVTEIHTPNMVIAFLDHLRQNRQTDEWLQKAVSAGIPTFVVGSYPRR